MSFIRSLSLITLGLVLCVSMLAGRDARARSEVEPTTRQSANVLPSPTPQPSNETNQPPPVRRFFSWTFDRLKRPFRRQPRVACALPPIVSSVSTSKSVISICPIKGNVDCSSDREVQLVANASASDIELLYTWSVTAGTISGTGRQATWDLSGVAEGTYTATVEVNDGSQHTTSGSTTVTVAICPSCDPPRPPCPAVSISCSNRSDNQTITFEATVAGGDPEMKATYNWSITAGKIVSGQGTSKLIVDISDLGSRSITATVSLGGVDPSCTIAQASCTNSH